MGCTGSKDSGTVNMVSSQDDSSSDSMPSQVANPIPCELDKDLNSHKLETESPPDAIGCSGYKDSRHDSNETLTSQLSTDLLPSQFPNDAVLPCQSNKDIDSHQLETADSPADAIDWSSLNHLKIDKYFKIKYFSTDAEENTAFILNALDKCSNLDKIFLENLSEKDLKWDKFINYSINMINNITELGLYQLKLSEQTFKLIFKLISEKSIKKISFGYLKINPSDIEILKNNKLIEVFIMSKCNIDEEESFIDFLSQLSNLKILESHSSIQKLNKIVDSLNLNNVDKIEEIVLVRGSLFLPAEFQEFNDSLCIFYNSQKKLRKLNLREVPLGSIIHMPSLQALEELEVTFIIDELLNVLPQVKNLKFLKGSINVLTNQKLINLSMCQQLKELKIQILSCNLEDLEGDEMNHFSLFENLESLEISTGKIDGRNWLHSRNKIDYEYLSALSKIKKIKHLEVNRITSCKNEMDKFEYLETFHISLSDISNEVLAAVINNSNKLKYCLIDDCKGVNNNFIKLIDTSIKRDCKLYIKFKKGISKKNPLVTKQNPTEMIIVEIIE